MPNRLGGVAATALSMVLRPLGYIIYGVLLVAYRRRERLIALGVMAAILAAVLLVVLL